MSIYYIKPKNSDVQFTLDSTSTMSIKEAGKTTDLPVESGADVSDHYINANTKINMSGVISSVKSLSAKENRSPEDYIREIKKLKESAVPFDVHFSDQLNPIMNCVFETLSISQSKVNGSVDQRSSYKVDMTLKKIRFANSTVVENVETFKVVESSFEEKTNSGKGTKEQAIRNVELGEQYIKKSEATLKTLQNPQGV